MTDVPTTTHYRTDVAKATVQTRWMLCSMPWLLLAALLWPLLARLNEAGAPAVVGWGIATLTAVQGIGATTAIAHSVGRTARPRALLGAMAAVTVLELGLLPYAYGTGHLDGTRVLVIAAIAIAIPPAFALSPLLGQARYLAVALVGSVATAGVVWSFDRAAGPAVLAFTVATWTVIGGLMRSSLWFLAVLWQLDAARETQARLMVAEERLRFARDLHDIIGRNLSVIALKSELVQRLTEHPKAQAELTEVQKLTRSLHQEIREVVKGYRTTDLATELEGARSVLEAAGITCRIERDGAPELGQDAQTALGWVVREGITNVLHHSHARTCTIALAGAADGAAELTITNDGGGHRPASGGGSGLAGLAERLAPLGGSLDHGPGADRTYRLRVLLPPTETPTEPPTEAPTDRGHR
ncbi:sensor histidine kinase [Kitasatospora sp. NPDC057904]|uniref:sensor histidine kinase n=1 Tax=unclassified Kitasatospora TaxID=2633591 RepID=UPI0036DE34FA